jgi:hypothetical protein
LALNSGTAPGNSVMPGLGNVPPMLRDGWKKMFAAFGSGNGSPGGPGCALLVLNNVGGVVRPVATLAPRLVELICHSGPCGVPATPEQRRVGAITVLPAPLVGSCEAISSSANVGGKWKRPSVSTVRDDSGAWLLEKNDVVRARLTAMLSESVSFAPSVE